MIREVLNRAGIVAHPPAPAGASGNTVLWEEFVQIYRRRLLNRVHDSGIVGTIAIEIVLRVMPPRPVPAPPEADSKAGAPVSG